MANRFYISGAINTTAAWSATSGGATGVSVPTAADDVFLDANSGNFALIASLNCRSMDHNGWTGSWTNTTAFNVTMGTSSVPASNIALRLSTTATYTVTGANLIQFGTTNTTQQTIFTNGKSFGNAWTVNGTGSSYQLQDGGFTLTGALTMQAGTLDTNGQNFTCLNIVTSGTFAKTLSLGASTITLMSATPVNFVALSNLTLNAGTSTLSCTFTGAVTFTNLVGALTFYNVTIPNATTVSFAAANSQNCTFNNLNITTSNVKTNTVTWLSGNTYTINGTYTFTANSRINAALNQASLIGLAVNLVVAASAFSNVDHRDIAGSGAGWSIAAATGGSGDCGGNSGITFTAAHTANWTNVAGGNWSLNTNWSSNLMPLPQDTVTFNCVFTTAATVVTDMARLGKSIDWTLATWSGTAVTWQRGTANVTVYDSVTFVTGMAATGAFTTNLEWRNSTSKLTFNGVAQTSAYLPVYPISQLTQNSTGSKTSLGILDGNRV